MVTNATDPPAPTTTKEDVEERMRAIREDAHRGAAYLLTGDASGRVRRNFLYILTIILIVVGLPLAALVPLGLLALTDAVIVP
jgi:hypothetical protein